MKPQKITQISVVKEILAVLTSQEKTTIKTYLSSFIEKGRESSNRSVKLFEILTSLKDRKMPDEVVEKILLGNSKPNAFNHQVARLRDKILEALIIDVNIERDGSYPETTRVNIAIRKNITQAQILQNRGARKIAELMFEKVIEQCKKHELFEELLIALRALIRLKVLNEGDKQLQRLLNKYEKYDYYKNAVLRAEINYGKVISKTDFSSLHSTKTDWYREMLDTMSDDFKKTRSIQIGYYYYYIETYYHQLQRNYKSARRSLLSIQRLLETGPVMNIPSMKGGVLVNLGENDLFVGQFERSYETLEKSLQYFKKDNFNYDQGVELMFYAKFYDGDYQMAFEIISQLLREPQSKNNFRKGKRSFLLASTFFMMGDFPITLRHLNMINPIVSDKDGWNLGIKILHILTLIELEEFDEATSKTDSLRKFFENGGHNHRVKMICQLLQSLSYSGYDFKAVYQKEKSCLDMLEEKSGALSWQIKSSEMIIFPQWFFAKVSRQKFTQVIPSFQLSENKNITVVNQE